MKPLQQLGSDDHAGQADHHGAGSGADLKEAFLLAVHTARQSYKAICESQSQDLHHALILCQRGNQHLVITDCPQQIAGPGL